MDTSQLGTYTLTYSASDASGNEAAKGSSSVGEDGIPPVITIAGELDITVEAGEPYLDEGAIVEDSFDTQVVLMFKEWWIQSCGGLLIRFNAQDASGNHATEVVRTVTVQDTTSHNTQW